MATSLSPVGIIWSMVSFVAMSAACVGYFMPYWLLGIDSSHHNSSSISNILGHQISFGTFRRCGHTVQSSTARATFDWMTNYEQKQTNAEPLVAIECGRYRSFEDIPSIWWQVSMIAVAIGCCLAIVVAFAAMLCCCIGDAMSYKMAVFGSILQIIAGCCVVTGCLLYPLGWDNIEVKLTCSPTVSRYQWGSCSVGWAFWTTLSAGAAMFLCSWLACYAAKRKGGYQRTPIRV